MTTADLDRLEALEAAEIAKGRRAEWQDFVATIGCPWLDLIRLARKGLEAEAFEAANTLTRGTDGN